MKPAEYKDLLKELKLEYLNSFPEKIENLQKLFDAQDWGHLEMEFHKLKGTGATYGVPEVTSLCKEMERLCKSPPSDFSKAFTSSLELLETIKEFTLKENSVDLENDERFQFIKSL